MIGYIFINDTNNFLYLIIMSNLMLMLIVNLRMFIRYYFIDIVWFIPKLALHIIKLYSEYTKVLDTSIFITTISSQYIVLNIDIDIPTSLKFLNCCKPKQVLCYPAC